MKNSSYRILKVIEWQLSLTLKHARLLSMQGTWNLELRPKGVPIHRENLELET